MIRTISDASRSDARLADLLEDAVEYARVYVLARQRQKGCDCMGELGTLKEECRDVVDKVIQYSQEKKYIPQDISYDIDSIAAEIFKGL